MNNKGRMKLIVHKCLTRFRRNSIEWDMYPVLLQASRNLARVFFLFISKGINTQGVDGKNGKN